VHAEPLLAQQAFLHLVRNAIEAQPSNCGQICVRSGTAWFGHEQLKHARPRRNVTPSLFAYLEVQDEGPGIAPAELGRVFDPFYSSKFLGRGFGLPLAVAMMRRMGGLVRISSNRSGTRASLLFAPAKPGLVRA
jgi:signal transduction histidine kinase